MPYKIVQTIENGKLRLSAVPSKWEQGGTLFWPKSKQERLRRQEECEPDRTWNAYNCMVKRSNISTFEKAEAEIDSMSDKSDTETDSELRQTIRPSRMYHDNTLPSTTGKSFNEMAAEELVEVELHEPIVIASGAAQEVTQEENIQKSINTNQPSYVFLNQEPDIPQIQDDIKSMKQDIKTILENQGTLCDIQNHLLLKISEFQTQFEEYIKMTSKPQQRRQDTATMEPIKNLNDIENFEKRISDAKTREELLKQMRLVCSKGPGKGTSNAYCLVDAMFDRSFFNICSWTGCSKGDTPKICFKGFSKTIQYFFDAVRETDSSFTRAELDKFFKIILKNSRKRCDSNQRMSSSKQRSKRMRSTTNLSASHESVQIAPPLSLLEAHVPTVPQPSQDLALAAYVPTATQPNTFA